MTFDRSLDRGKLIKFQELDVGTEAEEEAVYRGTERCKKVFQELTRDRTGLNDTSVGQKANKSLGSLICTWESLKISGKVKMQPHSYFRMKTLTASGVGWRQESLRMEQSM